MKRTNRSALWLAAIGISVAAGLPATAFALNSGGDDSPVEPIAGAFGPVPEAATHADGSTDGRKVPEYVEIIDHDGSTWYLKAVDAMPAVYGTFNVDDLNAPVPVFDRDGTEVGVYVGGELYLAGEEVPPHQAVPLPNPRVG
jgi:hypothetical protein